MLWLTSRDSLLSCQLICVQADREKADAERRAAETIKDAEKVVLLTCFEGRIHSIIHAYCSAHLPMLLAELAALLLFPSPHSTLLARSFPAIKPACNQAAYCVLLVIT